MNVLACPHCGRQFRVVPAVMGHTIRCRGCERMFVVPADGLPAQARMAAAPGPDAALAGMFEGTAVRSCPTCGHTFAMQPRLAGKAIRCRKCRSTFRVLHEEERVPPAEGARLAEAVRPSRDYLSGHVGGVAELIAVLVGGLLAFPASQLICWWGMDWDPFGVARKLRPELQWLAPEHLVADAPDTK